MKPMLFNTDMVRATLDGRKTSTRRVVKPQPEGAHTVLDCDEEAHTFDLMCGNGGEGGRFVDWAETVKAPFWPGDILYVRETWYKDAGRYMYKADYTENEKFYAGGNEVKIKWRPSIHMPKEAARIFLRVTDVWVEQLQDISPLDVRAEGVRAPREDEWDCEMSEAVMDRFEFERIWDSTIKPADLPLYGWEADPWVWVIEFERVSKPVEGGEG